MEPPTLVAVCVRDTAAKARVADSAASHRARIVHTSWDALRDDLDRLSGCALLVYDLAPWNETTQTVMRRLRHEFPFLPILAYAPVKPGVGGVIADTLAFRGVTLKLQFEDRAEVGRLREAVEAALHSTPVWWTKQIVDWLLPSLPNPVRDFLNAIFALFASGETPVTSLSARTISGRLGLDPRTVERACSSASLPPPRETLDWITLLTLAIAATRLGCTTAAASQVFGVSKRRLRNLREPLRAAGFEPTKSNPAAEFDVAIGLLARRCGIPADRVAEVTTRFVQALPA